MPNGALNYSLMSVAVGLATGDQVINISRSLPGSETSFILDFELYTEFNLTVTPMTGAGDGDASSVSIQTDQGGTYVYLSKCLLVRVCVRINGQLTS